jgi:hypothetical protein
MALFLAEYTNVNFICLFKLDDYICITHLLLVILIIF